ncbi:hypothetical protein [Legionella bozemanae]|uniref:hypothetical protein n=1 Tax=Legionella bozemanae TaxID=447 RepID=UPI001041340A|nr:hypothetical protein [Legionella bozemanae]
MTKNGHYVKSSAENKGACWREKMNDIELGKIEERLENIIAKKVAVSAQLRFDLFKLLVAEDAVFPEKIHLKIIRRIFDHDLQFAKTIISGWENKERANSILRNIETHFSQVNLPEEMNFFEHSYYCYILSAIMSGIALESLEKEYQKQINTMVYGVVHPYGEWTIKTEFENQNYSKFICHVSKTGLSTIQQLNDMTVFRVNSNADFIGLRMLALPCHEHPEFDGVKEMVVDGKKQAVQALQVLIHDLIHAAFLRRHLEKDPVDFRQRFNTMGVLFERVKNDSGLQKNKQLNNLVTLALYFNFHEFTTSIFVDGIPHTLPRRHFRAHGKYANEPQLTLRLAEKLHLHTGLFQREVDVETSAFKAVGIELDETKSSHQRVIEMMDALDPAFQYLVENYAEFYNVKSQNWAFALFKRETGYVVKKLTQETQNEKNLCCVM